MLKSSQAKVRQLRDVARQLREHASDMTRKDYIFQMLSSAEELETMAARLEKDLFEATARLVFAA